MGESGLSRGGAARNDGEGAGRSACPFCGALADAEAVRLVPGKHREMQVRRTGKRLLFDEARKETFLQWFAVTANIGFAAEQAGVCRQTVSRHRLSDPEFAARYGEALALAVPDLQARLLAYLQGRPTLNVVGELEPPDDAAFDPQLALQILRELNRMQQGAGAGVPLKRGRAPRVASNEEVEAALLKAVNALGLRESGGDD